MLCYQGRSLSRLSLVSSGAGQQHTRQRLSAHDHCFLLHFLLLIPLQRHFVYLGLALLNYEPSRALSQEQNRRQKNTAHHCAVSLYDTVHNSVHGFKGDPQLVAISYREGSQYGGKGRAHMVAAALKDVTAHLGKLYGHHASVGGAAGTFYQPKVNETVHHRSEAARRNMQPSRKICHAPLLALRQNLQSVKLAWGHVELL